MDQENVYGKTEEIDSSVNNSVMKVNYDGWHVQTKDSLQRVYILYASFHRVFTISKSSKIKILDRFPIYFNQYHNI